MNNREEIKVRLERLIRATRRLAAEAVEKYGYSLGIESLYDDLNYLDCLVEATARPPNVLEEANNLTSGDRRKAYAHPSVDFRATAQLMDAVLARAGYRPGDGMDIRLVPVLMMCVKLSRLAGNLTHKDSLVDIAGYARTLEMVLEQETNHASLATDHSGAAAR